ncbi:Flp pilus assembly protein CpaB [Caulobacter sp. NIBR2454]|uniref:Flp pilus assembly protein CpaB n=1 Tax=Caulobacter sp. NIBR2454 TaxID=3015996 RepID=UPI0022B6801F|nr:Flp pilus assembly protein CpaB [Caulobacter sp. NIBR2454]
MSAARILVFVVAAIAALGAWFVMRMASRPADAPVAQTVAGPSTPMTQVLVSTRELPIGTRLVAGDVTWRSWPADALNPAFITDGAAPAPVEKPSDAKKVAEAAGQMLGGGGAAQALEGAVVRESIAAGEPILAGKIVRGGEGGFMAAVLRPGMRAVAVPISVQNGAGGFILPGDRVDVLQSREVEPAGLSLGSAPKAQFTADTVLANIRVLAIDQSPAAAKGANTLIGAVATLEVSPPEAEALMRAKAQGDVVLALRPYADAGGSSGPRPSAEDGAGVVRIHRAGATGAVAVRP